MSTDFQTSDLGLAAYLAARGHALCEVLGASRGRRVFCFTGQACDDAPGYYAGALVPARAFANALRDLKALIRDH